MTDNRVKTLALAAGGVVLATMLLRRDKDVTAGRESVSRSVTIRSDKQTLYDLFTAPQQLPRFFSGLAVVEELGNDKQLWTFEDDAPGHGRPVHIEIADRLPPLRFEWRTAPGAWFTGGGSMTLHDAPGNRGVEARLALWVSGPLVKTASAVHRLFGAAPAQVAKESLRRFKSLAETGEIAQAVSA